MSDFGKINVQAEHQRIREMLSVYIDEELPSGDRARVEEHLAGCADCAWELDTLRQTVDLVGQLPKVPVPRAFTIHEALRPRRIGLFQIGWAYTYLKGATALAAVLLILVLVGDALFPFLQTTTRFAPAREFAAPAAAPTVVARQEAPPTPVELPGLAEKRSDEEGEGAYYAGATASPPTGEETKARALMPTPTVSTLRDYGLAAGAGATAPPLSAPVPSVSKAEATSTPMPSAVMEAPMMLVAVPTASPQPRVTMVAPPAAPLPPSAAPTVTPMPLAVATATATPVPTVTLPRVAKAPAGVRPTEESVLPGRPVSPRAPRLLRVVEASLCLLVMALLAATLIVRRRQ